MKYISILEPFLAVAFGRHNFWESLPPPRSAYDSEYSKGKLCDLIKSLEITKFLTNTRYVNKFS